MSGATYNEYAALERLRLRLHFMNWPSEPMWNAGTAEAPRWQPDWRFEIAVLEHVLHGCPVDVSERPSDTVPRNQLPPPTDAERLDSAFDALQWLFRARADEVTIVLAEALAAKSCGIPRDSDDVAGAMAAALSAKLPEAAGALAGEVLAMVTLSEASVGEEWPDAPLQLTAAGQRLPPGTHALSAAPVAVCYVRKGDVERALMAGGGEVCIAAEPVASLAGVWGEPLGWLR